MFKQIPFKKAHLEILLQQEMNAPIRNEFTLKSLDEIESCGLYSTIMGTHEPMICGGVTPIWGRRGNLWTVFSQYSGRCFVPVFRAMQRFVALEKKKFDRIEISIPEGFKQGIRRAQMLGFYVEARNLKRYLPDGSAATTMVWLKEDY